MIASNDESIRYLLLRYCLVVIASFPGEAVMEVDRWIEGVKGGGTGKGTCLC